MSQSVLYKTAVDFKHEATLQAALELYKAEDQSLKVDQRGNTIYLYSRMGSGRLVKQKDGMYQAMVNDMGRGGEMMDRLSIHYRTAAMNTVLARKRYSSVKNAHASGVRIAARSF